MSGSWSEGHGRTRTVVAAIWGLLLLYVVAILWSSRSGDPMADLFEEAMFGVLLAGFGVGLVYQYGTQETPIASASSLFVLSGLVQVVGTFVELPPALIGLANLAVFVGVGIYVVHWLKNWR